MEYRIEKNQCWHAQLQNIYMGCTLNPEKLPQGAKTARILTQVHGATILGDNRFEGEHQEADGLFTDQEGVCLFIRTADCVPIHVTDGHRIACIHAGWRGTEQGIVKRLTNYFDMANTHVAIGPAISASNYEVGPDLYESWLEKEPQLGRWLLPSKTDETRRMLNLTGYIRQQLLDMGVNPSQITQIPICTYDSNLPSYRRQGAEAKRIFNYIYKADL